jgi:hypothetical protein
MTHRLRLIFSLGLAALPAFAVGAPLQQATPVYVQPNAGAPVLRTLQPGANLPPTPAGASAPAGWIAVELAGPHEVYVEVRDMTKAQDVKPGAVMRAQPSSSAPVLAVAAANEAVEITDLRGRWTQLRLDRPITGYVQRSAEPAAMPPPVAQPNVPTPAASRDTTRPAPRPAAPAPTSNAAAAQAPGRAVPIVNRDDGGLAALPRLFEGRLVSTRSPLRPRRPYDFALEDHTGTRIAYVDISRLLLTDQIENYIGRHVAAYGIARPVPETKDIVITVESLQLR